MSLIFFFFVENIILEMLVPTLPKFSLNVQEKFSNKNYTPAFVTLCKIMPENVR